MISTEISKRVGFSLIFTPGNTNRKKNWNSSVQIEDIPVFDYRTIVRKKNTSGSITDDRKKSIWFQRTIKWMNTFPFSILIAEGGPVYLFHVVTQGNKAIKKNNITHIYSAFRPFTDHFAAFILKTLNPRVVWVADFRDLLFDPYFNKLYFKNAHRQLFKSIFKRADIITTVSDGLAQQLRDYNKNVITLKNGIINFPDHLNPAPCPFFTIAYTGSMYLDKKNALPLFMALKELMDEGKIGKEKARVIYAGKDSFYWIDMAAKFDFSSILDDKGNLPSAEAMLIQKEACINVLLTVSSKVQTGILTGKMIEYFEAGRPVLAIVVNQVDPELDYLLNEINIGKSYSDQPNQVPGIKDFIYDEYRQWEKTGTNRQAVDIELLKSKYSTEVTMRPLYEKLGLS